LRPFESFHAGIGLVHAGIDLAESAVHLLAKCMDSRSRRGDVVLGGDLRSGSLR
jgi:hypothetical protein